MTPCIGPTNQRQSAEELGSHTGEYLRGLRLAKGMTLTELYDRWCKDECHPARAGGER